MPLLPPSPPPPSIIERVSCSIQAANRYGIPASVMLAVASQEGGRPWQTVMNTNGTIDYGPMQINTVWLADLRKYGIIPNDVQAGCYPYYLAAWRLYQHLKKDKSGDFWQKIANYHSYTPEYNFSYRLNIQKRSIYWENMLHIHPELSSGKSYSSLQIVHSSDVKASHIPLKRPLLTEADFIRDVKRSSLVHIDFHHSDLKIMVQK